MPIHHAVMHFIDKKPDGSPAALHMASASLPESGAIENLVNDVNDGYNAKTGKAWGFFHSESGAYPLSGWLAKVVSGDMQFIDFTRTAVEHLTRLMEESNLAGGHVLFALYQQGLTDYLTIAILRQVETISVADDLTLSVSNHLDTSALHLAARINLSEWKNNPASRQYISFIKSKNGRKASDYFRDFIGCQEGIDSPSETRTLLKAFADFVKAEDMSDDTASEKSQHLVAYAQAQDKLGEPVCLDELSEVLDEERPKTFAEFIQAGDYGMAESFAADKRTLNQYRRYTGRAEGMSISFEAHLLGERVEFDQASASLTIKNLPTQLVQQLRRSASE
ncbi:MULTISPECIES: nucleoid-associated protein YejK [unclassified Pseudomonas]|uniref:nucleoid-associated protein YejK n=1 Tax=unclassified Pseudomonas TaxID=196821 RepID=UPI000A0A3381|nr:MULTISPECIES: nucleoid-associated protein YejK [unclassified Pseudomonas]SMF37006.1 nucleoid-associated protein [Pseudomonas sp. LAIL14HWK12:I11]SMR78963.1 nucleoid-associated protein [Pseudomonas sp. LAIL14HWK12:I10]SOD04721.1 nucleoid-associated protein [Pseudomonas sp. LAIL14HWK12:I8]